MSASNPTRRSFLQYLAAISLTSPLNRRGITQTQTRSLADLTATQAVAVLRAGEIRAVEYATALLDRGRLWRSLNALLWQEEEHIMNAAREADRAFSPRRARALHGLPILIKDNIHTAAIVTTAGTPAMRSYRPRSNARLVQSLLDAGALVFGKTNLHELAVGITNNNAAFGPVRNPYDLRLISGGSSGGNAAALAARLAPLAVGTDTGASIRLPAALCGIVGFRPSMGRYSLDGVVPFSHTRDTVGPMARSVADVALFDTVLTGAGGFRPVTLKGLRLGVPRAYFYRNLDSTIVGVVDDGLKRLGTAGCILVEEDIAELDKLYSAATPAITYYEMRADLERYLEAHGNRSFDELLRQIASPDVRALFETFVLGTQAPSRAAYEQALTRDRPALQRAYQNYFTRHRIAAMVFPTAVLPARPIGDDATVELNGERVPTFTTYLQNTRPMATAGIAGISMPIGLSQFGLPVGLEFDAPAGRDRELISIALAAEELFPPLPPPPKPLAH